MLGGLVASAVLPWTRTAAEESPPATSADHVHMAVPTGPPQQIAMVIHPRCIPLDVFGPHAVLAALGNVQVHLVWKTRDAVVAASGVPLQPTTTFAECPRDLTLLFVPGGLEGGTALMNDPGVLAFLQDRGQRAQYVTSVCTGSLLLGAAGLLQGYRATSHWTVRELLPLFGAEPVAQRVVEDRNRITAGGVTSACRSRRGCAASRTRRCCNCSWNMILSRRFRRAVQTGPVPRSRIMCAPGAPRRWRPHAKRPSSRSSG
jgi:cyclohexyl-isocyanide hydratase